MRITQNILSFSLILSILVFKVHGQICISEVMINPNNGRLPVYEYIELYNKGTESISLVGYQVQVGNLRTALPDRKLAPKQYLILVSEAGESSFAMFGNVATLSPWRVLNNTAATISLFDATGTLQDELSYSNRWYASASKRQGGWSLERVSPNYACNIADSWRESEATMGGTPGQRNSVFNDNFSPAFGAFVKTVTERSVRLGFALPLTLLDRISPSNFQLSASNIRIVAISRDSNDLVLQLSEPLTADKKVVLDLVDLRFCATSYSQSLVLFNPSTLNFRDIIINEVLFNPKVGGVDFVELYNRSNKTINLAECLLGNRTVTSEAYFLEPNSFCVLTTSKTTVAQDYPKAVVDRFLEMSTMPAYPNETGVVLLKNKEGILLDSLFYSSSMHQPFLVNAKGISLERQGYDLETNAGGTFTSASVLAGGATPGFENSVAKVGEDEKNKIFLQSRTCSPDQDGYEDFLIIGYSFPLANAMLNVTIYNDQGRSINRVVRNKSAGRQGEIQWDGLDEQGCPSPSGIYICYIELYNSEGHFQSFKEGFVLLNRLTSY